ncbi:MAG TPA: chemical-damaging agent resistance protein C, partial [Campylobacterales bacterium]|nr:chemical-damaging agent resistance protein C [Campylobacterales bacterium]
MATINLVKGGRVDLSKEAPSLVRVGVGLGWDINDTDTGYDFDLDVS